MKHKRNDPMCNPWVSQEDEKTQFLFLLVLIRNENITSEECKIKTRFK